MIARLQNKLEYITARWWFFLIIVLIQFAPPIASTQYDPSQIHNVIYSILGYAYVNKVAWIRAAYPVFQIAAILMLILAFASRGKPWRLFAVYCTVIYAWFAIVQSVGETPQFGLGIVMNNLVMMTLVSLVWLLEALVARSENAMIKTRAWHLLILIPALLAFWCPVNKLNGRPDFNPIYFLTSPSGTAFCLLTPFVLTNMIMRYPSVNIVTLRITSLVGFIIGWYNMLSNFGFRLETHWWNGILHLPLLLISFYGLILGYRRQALSQTHK